MFKKAKPLKDPASMEHGYNYALFLLTLRLRTEGEIRMKMQDRGYLPKVIKEVLDQLIKQDYVNDQRFAEMYLDNCKNYKYYGRFQIKLKMLTKKLPKELIESILEEQLTKEDETAIAKRFLKKEFPQVLSKPESLTYEQKQKIAHRLAARGFSGNVVANLIFDV